MAKRIQFRKDRPRDPDADFALYIDFIPHQGPAGRIFLAAQQFISAFESLDHTLCWMIDSSIEPVMVLEEIEAGSIKIWLRNALRAADDDGLKHLDWKPIVGKYLVRAKYLVLNWVEEEGESPKSLPDLARQLQILASETDVKQLPDYSKPKPQDLIEAIGKIQTAKDSLITGDKASFLSEEGKVELNLTTVLGAEQLTDLAVSHTIKNPPVEMILAVRRPDYLGQAQWEFRHGKVPIRARITHNAWLQRFQNREIDVRPGDALKCMVETDSRYGYDNELLDQKYVVTEVIDVLKDRFRQADLFPL